MPNAERPDSQGLCFIGDVPIAEFLKKELPQVKGDVLNVEGEVVGHHHGAYYYTLGQRHGFQTNFRAYVCASDVENNTITVVDDREDDVLYTTVLGVDEWHRIAREYALPCSLAVKIRYRQRDPVSATLSLDVDGKLLVTLDEKQWAVAPGQFVVAYDGDIVV